MDYITAAQAAKRWGTHPRVVQRDCLKGRIPGAKKLGRVWLLPEDSRQPLDPRKARRASAAPSYLPCVFLTSLYASPGELPAAGAEGAQCLSELCYLRGDFPPILTYAASVPKSAPTYLCALTLGASAAVSLGDYPAFKAFMDALERVKEADPGTDAAWYADAALATEAVSLYAPENAPEWLQNGDFSAFPLPARPWLGYLYVKYLINLHRFEAALAAGRAFLALTENAFGARLYLLLMCAASGRLLEQEDTAQAYLEEALRMGMPQGFLTPFAETVTYYGGLLETLMQRDWKAQYGSMTTRLEGTWKRWLAFHNQFTKDNVTLVLTLQEYKLACLLVSGRSYAEAGRQLRLSVGRIRNLVSDIYGKLGISGKSELAPYIL